MGKLGFHLDWCVPERFRGPLHPAARTKQEILDSIWLENFDVVFVACVKIDVDDGSVVLDDTDQAFLILKFGMYHVK